MSRRLDISALLCDDDQPEHVVLAPHLTSPTLRTPTPSSSRFVGLDALVHAATEERRRLSGGDIPHHHQPSLSPQFHRTAWHEEQTPHRPNDILRSPRQSYEDDQRIHQMRQYQDQKRAQDMLDRERIHRAHELDRQHRIQQEADRLRLQEADRLADIERKAHIERQKMEEERRRLEAERMRLLEVERRLQEQEARRHQEEERQRREAERLRQEEERRELERREREIATIREAERREQQRREREAELRDIERKRQQEEHRMYEMQQRAEMERQRNEDIQRRLAQQQQHYAMQRIYEPPPRIEIPPGPQIPTRKSEPGVNSQSPVLLSDPRPTKKPRYSESPSLLPMSLIDDKERIAREREKMIFGEIGYGRVESPPASSNRRPSSGHGPRRPVSVSDLLISQPPNRPPPPASSSASSSSSPIGEPPRTIVPQHHRMLSPLGRRSPPGSHIGRAKAARKSDEHHVPASLGVHAAIVHSASTSSAASSSSPRATATGIEPMPLPLSSPPPPPVKKLVTIVVKEEQQPSVMKRQKVEEPQPSAMPVDATRKTPTIAAKEKEQHQRSKQLQQLQEEDAHDWLLEHYAESSPPSKKEPAHQLLPPQQPRTRTMSPAHPKSPVAPLQAPIAKKQPTPAPTPPLDDDDDDTALNQELEELLAEVKVPSSTIPAREEETEMMDVDVDSAVAELVQTLEADDEDEENAGLHRNTKVADQHKEEEEEEADREINAAATNGAGAIGLVSGVVDDVEDELLSLIDDKLPPPSSAARRASGSSSGVTPLAPKSGTKNLPPPPLRLSDPTLGRTTSPAALLSAAPTSKHASASSERGSMPPPSSVVSGKKIKLQEEATATKKKKSTKKQMEKQERAGSVTPTTAIVGAGRKKDSTVKGAQKVKATTITTSAAVPTPAATALPASVKPRAKGGVPKGKKGPVVDLGTPAPASATGPTPTNVKASATSKPGGATATVQRKKPASVSASRSRSTSAMPPIAGDENGSEIRAEKQEEEEDSDANEDDKLYCVCKTKYDQERFMIACDRCDEWYHMQCVDMPELLADLVDQFFCPPCIQKNPELSLRTTYKQRCLWGLKCPDPSSPRACHKPARGAFSKYCSDECGVKYMQSRIDSWAKKGGKKETLWDSVKAAEKREGVVVKLEDPGCNVKTDGDDKVACHNQQDVPKNDLPISVKPPAYVHLKPAKPTKSKMDREKERLRTMLGQVRELQDGIKRGMEVIKWREKVLHLAIERAEVVGQCGWDQRLCFGDEDWAEEFGHSVLESYTDASAAVEKGEGEGGNNMDVDEEEDEEEWWCPGDTVCTRHLGWQTTRYKDVCKEKGKKEEALSKLETREQEIRKRLEEMANPSLAQQRKNSNIGSHNSTTTKMTLSSQGPLAVANAKLANGHSNRPKPPGGDGFKKGKKRKAPA